jgi:hypothetical protein
VKSNEALENLKNLNILKRIKEIEQNAKAQIENFVSTVERTEPKPRISQHAHSKPLAAKANSTSLFPEIEPVIEVVEPEAVIIKPKQKIPLRLVRLRLMRLKLNCRAWVMTKTIRHCEEGGAKGKTMRQMTGEKSKAAGKENNQNNRSGNEE